MTKVEVVHPSDLGAAELSAWSALQAATPDFGHPLLGASFASLIGRIRPDARVAIWSDSRGATGFLGFHKTLGGFARPIGAPFSDYHAMVTGPCFDAPSQALKAAGLQGLRVTGLVDPHRLFPQTMDAVPAHRIELADGAEAYFAGMWSASRNRWRNHKRYSRRLGRTIGPLRVVAGDVSPETFRILLGWKRRQLAATGLHDFTAAPWVDELFHRLFEMRNPRFGGLMISLYAGERPVAAHFGLRQDGWFHPWLGAYDPELAGYSPGTVHQVMATAAAAEAGIRTYDLGPRADRAKTLFANSMITVRAGLAPATSLQARLAAGSERLIGPPHAAFGLLGHLRDRWDHVAAVEPTLGGRVAGMARAAGSLHRRMEAWSQAGRT